LIWILSFLFGTLGFMLTAQAGGPIQLEPGQIYDARIPTTCGRREPTKALLHSWPGVRHGPLPTLRTRPTVVIRDPAHPSPRGPRGTLEQWFLRTTLRARIYTSRFPQRYLNIRHNAGGVSNTEMPSDTILYRALSEAAEVLTTRTHGMVLSARRRLRQLALCLLLRGSSGWFMCP
jgi:hypothetical protein